TQIKGRLKEVFEDRLEVDLFYPNAEFVRYFGADFYKKVSSESTFTLINDWLFRHEAFDNVNPNFQDYLERYYPNQNFENNIMEKIERLGDFIENIIERYHLTAYDLAGIGTTYSTVSGMALCRHLKRKNKKIITVLGGSGFYKEMGEAVSHYFPHVDYVCSGSGLISFPRLVGCIMENDQNGADSIDGILTKNNRGKIKNVGEELDINHHIHLDYDDFFETVRKFNLDKIVRPSILLETSRGCYWRKCKFCGLNEDQLKYRVKKSETAVEEINHYSAEYQCNISMVDNIMPRNYIKTVLPNLRIKPGTRLMYEVKADYDEEEMEILSRANVTFIQPGIESLNTGVLEIINKGVNAFQCVDLLKQCIRYNIVPGWNLIVGFPNMTEEMYKRLVSFIPHLVHLYPPEILTPVRFDRYSTYWEEREKYNLELSPFNAYQYIYPYEDDFQADIAYYFEDKNLFSGRLELMSRYYETIDNAVASWQKWWQTDEPGNVPKLYCREENGAAVIFDSRRDGANEYKVSPLTDKMLKFLETPETIDSIETNFPAENREKIITILQRLDAKDMLFKEKNRYLSLVIQPRRQ
ncbi:MAG: RiPP maturation radical SAM protein 1, partial [bacterium]|nr:RiPP maturation radical SAM protein 1 [bacterium]